MLAALVPPTRPGVAQRASRSLQPPALPPLLSTRSATILAGAFLAAGLAAVAAALAQTPTTARVVRGDSVMVLTNYAFADVGGRSYFNLACDEGMLSTIFYGRPQEVELVIDDDTRLRGSLAILNTPAGDDGEGQETIELLDGTVTFAATGRPCIEQFEPDSERSIVLKQGRTTVQGARFFLDQETDIAEVEGPISLNREAAEGSEELSATAASLSYDLERNVSILVGDVQVTAGERISSAERLELDEDAGVATLVGNPAVSREGEDEITGTTLLYYLDSNDVVVEGGVQGTLEVDLE